MRYFVPDLSLGVLEAQQTELVEKFGGLPWGLSQEKWPLCTKYGLPLSHLFTLRHDTGRLNLGKTGRVLMAFMCNHQPGDCETWDMDSGANAVLILEEDKLGSGLTSAPEGGAKTEVEAFIVSWRLGEDAVPEAREAAFFDDYERDALPYETRDAVCNTTKLGGLPAWVQFPEGPAVPPFRFVGQFNSELIFLGQPPQAKRAFCPIYRWNQITKEREAELPPEKWLPLPSGPSAIHASTDDRSGDSYRCDGPSYGGSGMAYLFLSALPTLNLFDTDPSLDEIPQGKFLWQCT